MQPPVFLPQINVEEFVSQILISRQVTRMDEHLLMWAMLIKDSLDEGERTLINRVFYGVRHGLLRVIE